MTVVAVSFIQWVVACDSDSDSDSDSDMRQIHRLACRRAKRPPNEAALPSLIWEGDQAA
jgi:hypothetical protein